MELASKAATESPSREQLESTDEAPDDEVEEAAEDEAPWMPLLVVELVAELLSSSSSSDWLLVSSQ